MIQHCTQTCTQQASRHGYAGREPHGSPEKRGGQENKRAGNYKVVSLAVAELLLKKRMQHTKSVEQAVL